MKKVMCIDDSFGEMTTGECPDNHPYFHGKYHVVSEWVFRGLTFYILHELPGYSWEKSAFVDTSDIDETELVKERESELLTA
ncbi:MAG: hypothetical protein QM802_20030 [Agriterribacter sp.]